MAISAASVVGHTTASTPRPHILYTIEIKTTNGKASTVSKRYSDVCRITYIMRLIPSLTHRSSL